MKHSGNISTVSMRHQVQPSQLCGTWAAHSVYLKTSFFSHVLAPCHLHFPSFSSDSSKASSSSSYRPPFGSLGDCWGDQCISEPCSEERAWETFAFRAGSIPSLKLPPWFPDKHLLNISKSHCWSYWEHRVSQDWKSSISKGFCFPEEGSPSQFI